MIKEIKVSELVIGDIVLCYDWEYQVKKVEITKSGKSANVTLTRCHDNNDWTSLRRLTSKMRKIEKEGAK
ncbi:hypothetical protein [Bacillus phage BC-T25]|nr:hypothetical protein [Bacillus phage BC-T25]